MAEPVVQFKSNITTDEFGRLREYESGNSSERKLLREKYLYKADSVLVDSIEYYKNIAADNGLAYSSEGELRYTYDSNNNIAEVKDINNSRVVLYEYDGYGRAIEETMTWTGSMAE